MQPCYVCQGHLPEEWQKCPDLTTEKRAVCFVVTPGVTASYLFCYVCGRVVCDACAPRQESGFCEECIKTHGLEPWLKKLEDNGVLPDLKELGGILGVSLEEAKAAIELYRGPFRGTIAMGPVPPRKLPKPIIYKQNPEQRVIKKARYRNFGGDNEFSEVVYAILGDKCVFSGITPPPARTSTVNAAEDIIEILCRQEGLHPQMYSFFDLQTQQGYQKRSNKRGEFDFDQVTVQFREGKFSSPGWIPTKCPPEVSHLFGEYIGENPQQMLDEVPWKDEVQE